MLLTVAMMDPLDINALDAIEVYTNCEVEAVICTEQQLNQLHTTLYGTYAGIGGVLEDLEDVQIDKTPEKTANLEDVEVSSLQGMAQEAPVVRLVNSILSQGVREGASDIHISPEKDHVQIRFRVDGKLHEVPAPPKSMFLPIISRLKILANMDIAESRVPQDGRFTVKMKDEGDRHPRLHHPVHPRGEPGPAPARHQQQRLLARAARHERARPAASLETDDPKALRHDPEHRPDGQRQEHDALLDPEEGQPARHRTSSPSKTRSSTASTRSTRSRSTARPG